MEYRVEGTVKETLFRLEQIHTETDKFKSKGNMDKQVMTTDFFEKQNVIYNSIALRRKELMGIAILSVILYHWFSWCKYGYLDMFHYLYIGVDVFLLLSGFGLCFSYNKCNLPRFYRRRLLRVFPLFVVFNLFLFLVSLKSATIIQYTIKGRFMSR